MTKKIDLNKICKKNPHIKKEELRKITILGKELLKSVLCPRGYQLLSPFERRYDETDEEKIDPRTINLSAMYD
jgi:hypothetical protein